jgi:hypothetical protein
MNRTNFSFTKMNPTKKNCHVVFKYKLSVASRIKVRTSLAYTTNVAKSQNKYFLWFWLEMHQIDLIYIYPEVVFMIKEEVVGGRKLLG